MYGVRELKAAISVTELSVECPVKGCSNKVKRQRRSFKRESQFRCPQHKIYISPSTFEYPSEGDNLIWKDSEDLSLLRSVKTVKRESRMARDNSEDALSWNVFRYLESTDQLPAYVATVHEAPVNNVEIIYWSYSQKEEGIWSPLIRTCAEFGEHLARRSEPDLIVASDEALFWIEVKLTATNRTTPSSPKKVKNYLHGGDSWYEQVLESDYQTVAIEEKKYELMRFWLLGSWTAAQLDRDFYLISLLLKDREPDIEQEFMSHIKSNPRRRFIRTNWEDIYQFVANSAFDSPEKRKFENYFENKTLGYDHSGQLRLAFAVDQYRR